MNRLQLWLMRRYCPKFDEGMPKEDDHELWVAEAIVVFGYWGTPRRVVAAKEVRGYQQAYRTARWLALKADWLRPEWLFHCGIMYGVREPHKTGD
jgi:hypothetical protein